jgi:hypothetical protein
MRRPIASVEFFETCLEIGVNRALVCRAAGRVAGIETENPSLRYFRSDYGRSAPHARLTRYQTFSGIDRPLAFGKAWPASRRNIGVGQLVRWGVQRFYGGRQAIRTVGDWIKNPGSRYLTQCGYGIRAPGAVALGTMRPSYTETIREFGSASRTPPPHSP